MPAWAGWKIAPLNASPSVANGLFESRHVALRRRRLKNLHDRLLGLGDGDEARDDPCGAQFAQQRHQPVGVAQLPQLFS